MENNMLASRVLSRFLPVAEGHVSLYEGARRVAGRPSDLEANRRTYSDHFQDDDDNPEAFLLDPTTERPPPPDPHQSTEMMSSPVATHSRPRWHAGRRQLEEDEDVPASLLLEPRGNAGRSRQAGKAPVPFDPARAEEQWRTTQDQQGLHTPRALKSSAPPSRSSGAVQHPNTGPQQDPRADAFWYFTNAANNLDGFLLEVYQYYVSHGLYSIMLARILDLLTELFVFSFAMFLTTCIDFSEIPASKSTQEVLIPKCMVKAGWLKNTLLFLFVLRWLYQSLTLFSGVERLRKMRDFFEAGLGISDHDIQTVSWRKVVDGIQSMQNAHVGTAAEASDQARKYVDYRGPRQRLNAESIANRLMRQANYYVAMYNKDILEFRVPIPFLGTRHFYSRSLEWCIDSVFTNFIFDETGSIRPFCLDVKNRSALVGALRTRFRVAALCSIILAPWTISHNCILYFFKYYTEFTKNPARANMRSFTPHAEWKIREFNELPHLFGRRLRQAGPFANEYLKQFPKDRTDQLARFVAFLAGAVGAVLALLTLWDPDLFLNFDITPGRNAFFYLTMTATIWGIAHGMLPEENEVHDPVLHLKEVLLYTHYMPNHWKERLHSEEVRSEFSSMYKLKILIFAEEISSLVVAPWILWQNSGKNCERIVDFFREQTVHIEGIGYQCNFAYFNFKKDPNAEDPTALLQEPDGLRNDYYGLKNDKMAASMHNFMQYYSHINSRQQRERKPPGWQPPPIWPVGIPGIAEEADANAGVSPARRSPSSVRKSGVVDRTLGTSAVRSPRQAGYSTRRKVMKDVSEDSANPKRAVGNPATYGVSESRMMAQDSDLQDFADAPGLSRLESDTDADEMDGNDPGAAGGGVLGMVSALAKAQTEKTGPVKI